jgi:hypothetical protein
MPAFLFSGFVGAAVWPLYTVHLANLHAIGCPDYRRFLPNFPEAGNVARLSPDRWTETCTG